MSFANQVAIVTGASSGIGWALAHELVRQGARVGLIARREDRLKSLAHEIGPQATYVTADIADREQTLSAFRELAARLGSPDLVIANAGLSRPTFLKPFNVEEMEAVFRVNVFGLLYTIDAVLPEMLKNGRGHIAAVSSLAAYMGFPGKQGYAASKAAVSRSMEGLRIQLRGTGITITTICPGFVRSEMTATHKFRMPWLLEADDAARRILKALARKRKVYDFPWQTSLFMRLIPWLPDWFLARALKPYEEIPE